MAIVLSVLVSLAVNIPLALGGEAEGANNTGLGIISLVSIALGWAFLAGLWWFVFRDKARSKRKNGSSD
jgi:hypothetical protein